MSADRYCAHLPEMLTEWREFAILGEIESPILEEAAAAGAEIVQNQWILTAARSGLLRLAGIMRLTGAAAMETEALRAEILFRWNSRSPYTEFSLRDWLDSFCGADGYRMALEREAYTLTLTLELREKEKKTFLETYLRRILPANLLLRVQLNTNTHGRLHCMTHGQMHALGWRYGEIPFEDLRPYEAAE